MLKLSILVFSVLVIFSIAGAETFTCDPTTEPVEQYVLDDNGKIVTVPATVNTDGTRQLKYIATVPIGSHVYKAKAKAGTVESDYSNTVNYEKKPSTPVGCTMIK
jgi:hypothetical protein